MSRNLLKVKKNQLQKSEMPICYAAVLYNSAIWCPSKRLLAKIDIKNYFESTCSQDKIDGKNQGFDELF